MTDRTEAAWADLTEDLSSVLGWEAAFAIERTHRAILGRHRANLEREVRADALVEFAERVAALQTHETNGRLGAQERAWNRALAAVLMAVLADLAVVSSQRR